PFRTKVVEPIDFTTREERANLLLEAGFNLFNLKAKNVIIDLLTDSGTSAMSSHQWAELMRGDESYAGCSSFFKLEEAVSSIFGFSEVIPVHQGRAAERILFGLLVKPGHIVPSNTHFDTTRANIESGGGIAIDLPVGSSAGDSHKNSSFRGNIDLEALEALIKEKGTESIPFGMITLTNNSAGGQPVCLENIEQYSRLLKQHSIPFYIDAARYAENAWLIKTRSEKHSARSINDIVTDIFRCADGCLMSAKKDGLANIGGFIALNDELLSSEIKQELILTEGFPTYGGLTGRDLECIAVGLKEALEEPYLLYRQKSSMYLARGLQNAGIPIVDPPGLHAIYLDARAFLEHIEPGQLPGQTLVCQLYLEAGIRSCEIGTVMFGKTDKRSGKETPHTADLVRLALPRRVYSQSHYDYVIEAIDNVFKRRAQIEGMKIAWQPERLRHFSARFQPLSGKKPGEIPATGTTKDSGTQRLSAGSTTS
ncbi:MAG: tryptophanase, partial [Candidatus Obscuribacterales bacterium]|nr:tryptophanase [Candidatus Obscuribacterales bacterium]